MPQVTDLADYQVGGRHLPAIDLSHDHEVRARSVNRCHMFKYLLIGQDLPNPSFAGLVKVFDDE